MKMSPDIKVGNLFPNFELPDHGGERLKLSQRMRGFPTIIVF